MNRITQEVRHRIEVLNIAYRLFSEDHRGVKKWADSGKALQQIYFEKAEQHIEAVKKELSRKR